MNKGKSIFSKYFIICSAVILVSFICLGAVLLLVSSRYFIQEKKDLLTKNCAALTVDSIDEMLEAPSDWYEFVIEKMKNYSMSCTAHFVLCDKNGKIIEKTYGSDNITTTISQQMLDMIGDEVVYINDDFQGCSTEECHVAGIKFVANGPVYYMLAVSGTNEQDDYIWNIMEIFLISSVMVLVIVLIIVYFTTLKLTEPVKEIAAVSKKLGSGDFGVTLPAYDIAEFQQLSCAFNDMAASLKNYDTMRNSFVANVSHELRTPMTSIAGFVDGILDGTIPPEEERRYMKIISSEVHRLTRLVRSMLNLAKIESGEKEPELSKFSALEPIVDTLVTFETRLEDKHIDIRGLDVDRVWLYADNDLIHQVMYNLIENAIKFVDDGGYIEFSFNPIGNVTVISIKNSGGGLSEEELALVFDRFYKTDKSRGLDAQGVGLGLNIVRSIIKLHNGKIMVKSVQGEYTEFIFTLPNSAPDWYK